MLFSHLNFWGESNTSPINYSHSPPFWYIFSANLLYDIIKSKGQTTTTMWTTATSSGGAATNKNSTSNDRINSMKMIYCVRAIGCCFRCDLIWWFDHISAAKPSNRCWHRLVIGVEIYVKNFESCSFDLLCRIISTIACSHVRLKHFSRYSFHSPLWHFMRFSVSMCLCGSVCVCVPLFLFEFLYHTICHLMGFEIFIIFITQA